MSAPLPHVASSPWTVAVVIGSYARLDGHNIRPRPRAPRTALMAPKRPPERLIGVDPTETTANLPVAHTGPTRPASRRAPWEGHDDAQYAAAGEEPTTSRTPPPAWAARLLPPAQRPSGAERGYPGGGAPADAQEPMAIVRSSTASGVQVDFVTEQLSFTGEDNAMGILLLTVMGVIAESESLPDPRTPTRRHRTGPPPRRLPGTPKVPKRRPGRRAAPTGTGGSPRPPSPGNSRISPATPDISTCASGTGRRTARRPSRHTGPHHQSVRIASRQRESMRGGV
jgi:hypothetical protein